jgi:hypothetical protein
MPRNPANPNIPYPYDAGDASEEAALTGGSGGGAIPGMFDPNKPQSQNELYRLMLSQAPYGMKERQLARQSALADELRGTAEPGMRHVGAVHVAANPLEFLGAGLKRYMGDTQRRDSEAAQDKLFEERLEALKRMGQ